MPHPLNRLWSDVEGCLKDAARHPALRNEAEKLLDGYFGLIDILLEESKETAYCWPMRQK